MDDFCKTYDIAYNISKDLKNRHTADQILADQAWTRVKGKNSSLGEKTAAWLVKNIMKAKIKTGSGLKKLKPKKGGNIIASKKQVDSYQ